MDEFLKNVNSHLIWVGWVVGRYIILTKIHSLSLSHTHTHRIRSSIHQCQSVCAAVLCELQCEPDTQTEELEEISV